MNKCIDPRNEITIHRRIMYADERGNHWLALGNQYLEAGNKDKAQRCYEKGQFWLDRLNKLLGNC